MYIILPFNANHNSHAVEVYSKIKDIPFPTNVPVRCYRINKKIYNELELNYYNIHKNYSHSVTLPRFQIAYEVPIYKHELHKKFNVSKTELIAIYENHVEELNYLSDNAILLLWKLKMHPEIIANSKLAHLLKY